MAKWEEDYDPNQIANRLEKIKTVNKNNNVSFQGFDYLNYLVVLNSMVSLNREIPQLEKKRIIEQATFKSGAKGKITTPKLLLEIEKLESEYLSRPVKNYNLLTSISVSKLCKLKRKKIDGCTISFRKSLPKIYIDSISEIKQRARQSIVGEIPNDYTYVKVNVSAKSHSEAVNKALDVLDLIRGIWNFFENRKHVLRNSFGKRMPVNKYILGPLHTLHEPNGKLATKFFWYEPEYVFQIKPYNPTKEIDKLYKFESLVRNLIKKSKCSADLIAAVLRYTRALDLTNWEDAFLRLWSVLEHLTGTGHNDSHKVTVRRAAFIFGGEEYVRQVLMHLKDYRNRAVHADSENHDIESYMYQLKRFVEVLMNFQMNNRCGSKNINDSSKVLDLPCDRKELRNRRKMLAIALNFLR